MSLKTADNAVSPESKAPENNEVKDIVKTCLTATSIKGVAKLMRSPAKVSKCVWLLGTLFGASVGIMMTVGILQQYFAYETVVKIEKCLKNCPPSFPDVTVCHRNPLAAFPLGHNLRTYGTHKQMIYSLQQRLYNESQSLGEENDGYIAELYSVFSYLDNLDLQEYRQTVETEAGLNFLVHDCKW